MNAPITVMQRADENNILFAELGSDVVFGQTEFDELTKIYQNPRSSTRAISSIAAAIVLSSQANALLPSTSCYQPHPQIAVDVVKLNYFPNPRGAFDSPRIAISEKPETAEKRELETIFNGLAKKWKDETRWSSITMRRYAHSSYQAILVLGGKEPREVTKLILKQMQKKPDMWFEALRRLNSSIDDPAKNSKSFEESTEAWLAWGRMSGLIS